MAHGNICYLNMQANLQEQTKRPACGNCTLKCVSIAYKRAPWFRLVRAPLVVGIRYFAAIHHARSEVEAFPFPTNSCRGCLRFYKTVIMKKSASFRWLHRRLNPFFDFFVDRLVTPSERREAHEYAVAASAGTVTPEQSARWMLGMKTGLRAWSVGASADRG